MNKRILVLAYLLTSGLLLSFFIRIDILTAQTIDNQIKSKTKDSIGNTAIDVTYQPIDHSGLNWKDELEMARVITTLDGKGIRITLPNSDWAKVIIMDKAGERTLQTISYVSPAIIDISTLKKGSYQLILSSHHV